MGKTEHEKLLQRKQNNLRERAQYHWALLRKLVRSVRKAVKEADVKEIKITHGIHRERKLNHDYQICQVLYIPQHKEYVSLDGQTFHIFCEDGQKKYSVQSPGEMNRMTYSCQTNQFVGWVHGQEDLSLMSSEFDIVSQSKAVGRILMAIYNRITGELITVGPHFMTCWMFRNGARYLIPRKTTKTNYGETNMFNILVLEEIAGQEQRIFFAQENGVVVYNVFSGLEIAHKKELHSQAITALTYFNPKKYIITGAKDGCIKVWDAEWKIKMVFVGHNDQVNFLKIYSHGQAFISASYDCTLRIWSMETCDQIDKMMIDEPIEGIEVPVNCDFFCTYSNKTVDLWKLHHLYQIHTYIGYEVSSIRVTSHPLVPQRAVVLCQDSSVRIICPSNGEVITTLLMKPTEKLIDAAYAVAEDTIFAVMFNGDIVKGLTSHNPCLITSHWKCSSTQDICNCLLVYEYVVDPFGSSDVWSLTKHSSHASTVRTFGKQQSIKNRTLLLGGRKDGYICVFDWHTGEVTFKVEAHGSKGVFSMAANVRSDQLITAGMDNVIKVWRLYPFAQEALAPLMSFYCAHSPSFMTTMKTSLGVAFQDPSTATFTFVLYSLTDKIHFDHKPDDDHMDVITSLSACPRMKLYATSSIDGTIRIWNEDNTLLRVLHLNATPHSIAFCSPLGDLLVGIDKHLFHISHSKFLPKSYQRKQICMRFSLIKEEQALEYDENRLNLMDKTDVKRLKNAYASFKYTSSTDDLSHRKKEEVVKEKNKRKEAFCSLEFRDNEIKQIRDGALKPQCKRKSTKQTQDAAFREYMKMYYNKEREKVILDEMYYTDTLQKKLTGEPLPAVKDAKKYGSEQASFGFFSELGQKTTEQDSASLVHWCGPTGFLPNSVLIKILHPPPVPKQMPWEMMPYQPPELTLKQLAEIQSLYKKQTADSEDPDLMLSRTVTFADDDRLSRVIEIDFTDEEEVKLKSDSGVLPNESITRMMESPDESWITSATVRSSALTAKDAINTPDDRCLAQKKVGKKKVKVDEDGKENEDRHDGRFFQSEQVKPSSLMSKFQEILKKPSSQTNVFEDLPKPASSYAATKRPASVLTHPVAKYITHPKPKPQTPVSSRSPTPPPPATPLPDYIKKFVGTDWFDKYFPNCKENTLPKPWTSDAFVSMICRLIHVAEWSHKVNVTDAILYVHTEEGLSWPVIHNVAMALVAVLNHHTSPPSCSVSAHKDFILSAIKTLAALAVKEKAVIVEVMVHFLDGDNDVRSGVLDMLEKLGLFDPHRQFQKELDSWDVWNIDEQNHRKELHNISDQWLERWMTLYKMRIKENVDLLQQGSSSQKQTFSKRTATNGLERGSVKSYEEKNITSSHRSSKMDHHALSGSAKDGQRSSLPVGSYHVVSGSFQSVIESVSYIDAVTFFCETITEKELEALKRGEPLRGKQEDKVLQAKNTVLVLPSISRKPALTRLGELHVSQCRPERETVLHTEFHIPQTLMRGKHRAPGDLNGFVSFINLPMKNVCLNPFPSASDERDSHVSQTSLITLKASQKYFIPRHSYIPINDHVTLS